jgi:hypothetical protein
VYDYDPNHSQIFEDHHGVLLVQNGALMNLQQGFQVAYLTTVQSNMFSYNFLNNSKSVEIWKKLLT